MELKKFYICINEEREATALVEAHDLDEAYDRLNSAYIKNVVELDKDMLSSADMEDVTALIDHNGWYRGRAVDFELPYGRKTSDLEETTASEETAEDTDKGYTNKHEQLAKELVDFLAQKDVCQWDWVAAKDQVDRLLGCQRILPVTD